MKHSLYYKLILGYILFGLLGILLINMWTTPRTMSSMTSDRASNLYADGSALVSSIFRSGIDNVITDIQYDRLHLAAKLFDSKIWIINADNRILFDSSDQKTNFIITDFDPTDFGNQSYMTGHFYDQFAAETLTVMIPITSKYKTVSHLLIHQSTDSIAQTTSSVIEIVYQTFAIIFLFSLIILILFTLIVYLPVRKLSVAANEYAKGNLEYNGLESFTTEDEIGRLGVSLNFMASELHNLEEDQKKFIANVSHDFRSPLTSIKGYAEAMKDGTIPFEMQDKYLDIMLFEANRLTKLTESLLTLNAWDTKGNRLELTDFRLYSVLKPIVASFEGKCKKKNLSINLVLGSKEYMVAADKEKITQVIYNLVDNAVKFSHSDSTITIEVTDKSEKIFVSVKDTGIGIPKDSIMKIWDRFYKTDLSRGKDKTGSGLGLAITKEIIQSHGENINVISTEGAGTEFVFSLKRAKR